MFNRGHNGKDKQGPTNTMVVLIGKLEKKKEKKHNNFYARLNETFSKVLPTNM